MYRNVLRRITFDKTALTAIKFQQKCQEYSHLIHQSELYIYGFILKNTNGILCFENKIIEDIQLLEDKIYNETASNKELNTYQNLKNELELIEEERALGFWNRYGLERIHHDEKSTSSFLKYSQK